MVKLSNRILIDLFVLFLIIVFATSFFFIIKIFVIDGTSMEPTLHANERAMVDKRAYVSTNPNRGDVIGFYDPNEPDKGYIKRVVAVGGDEVELVDRAIKINGEEISENSFDDNEQKIVIQEGYFYVLGDNRNHSYDSRKFGAVPLSNIIGRVNYVVWPISSFRAVK